jgi:hypothetical protein
MDTRILSLGRVVATPAAIEALTNSNTHPLTLLRRHASGDWAISARKTSRRTASHSQWERDS